MRGLESPRSYLPRRYRAPPPWIRCLSKLVELHARAGQRGGGVVSSEAGRRVTLAVNTLCARVSGRRPSLSHPGFILGAVCCGGGLSSLSRPSPLFPTALRLALTTIRGYPPARRCRPSSRLSGSTWSATRSSSSHASSAPSVCIRCTFALLSLTICPARPMDACADRPTFSVRQIRACRFCRPLLVGGWRPQGRGRGDIVCLHKHAYPQVDLTCRRSLAAPSTAGAAQVEGGPPRSLGARQRSAFIAVDICMLFEGVYRAAY